MTNTDIKITTKHQKKDIDKDKIQVDEYELRKSKRIKEIELRNPLKYCELRITLDQSSKIIIEIIPKQ